MYHHRIKRRQTIILKDFYQKLFLDKNGKIVLAQKPNLPLYGWLVFFVLSKLTDVQPYQNYFSWLSATLLMIWAILELVSGVNYFRRLIGVLVIIGLIVSNI